MTKLKTVILSVIVPIAIIVVIRLWHTNPLPKIISTAPPMGAVDISTVKPIEIAFDSPIDENQISVLSLPPSTWTINSKGGNIAVLMPDKYLTLNTKYSLDIRYANKTIYTLTFMTADGQGDPSYYQKVQDLMSREYPLATSLPYKTPSLRVVYSSPLTLEISLLAPGITADEATQEIKAWVTREGGDAAKHQYKVVPYSP